MINLYPLLSLLLLCALCLIDVCSAFSATSTSTSGASITDTDSHQSHGHDQLLLSTNQRPDRSIEDTEWRQYCSGCQRPLPQCLCEHLPSGEICLDTQVLVLQHPVEFRRKTISTVPLLKLVLDQCQVLVGRSFDKELEDIIDNAGATGRLPLLLFPGPDAITLEDSNAMDQLALQVAQLNELFQYSSSSDDDSNNTTTVKYLLIIVDGTWTQAKRMLRDTPILTSNKCQSIQFSSTNNKSIYDLIRKQPDSHCLSTLESCERTLQLLEPTNPNRILASKHLLQALKAMILTQMKFERRHLEKNPNLIRNVSKLQAKKERQKEILQSNGSSNNDGDEIMLNNAKTNNREGVTLPEGYTLRPLVESDAKYVDSIWPYSSNKSIIMIRKQINADNVNATKYGTSICLGIEHEEELVACIIRHRNGSVGILHTDEEHRRLGLGEVVLQEAMQALLERNQKVFAYIVDNNKPSEALFSKLGWVKADPLAKKGTGSRRAKRLWIYQPSSAE